MFKPVIAAVNGYAFAAGLETALLADIRIAAENAEFGALERRWNIVAGDGMTARLPLVVGWSRAMEMIITGRRVDAQEAERIGLANEVVPAGHALPRAQSLAHDRRAAQGALRSDKESLVLGVGRTLEERLRIETEQIISMFMRRDSHTIAPPRSSGESGRSGRITGSEEVICTAARSRSKRRCVMRIACGRRAGASCHGCGRSPWPRSSWWVRLSSSTTRRRSGQKQSTSKPSTSTLSCGAEADLSASVQEVAFELGASRRWRCELAQHCAELHSSSPTATLHGLLDLAEIEQAPPLRLLDRALQLPRPGDLGEVEGAGERADGDAVDEGHIIRMELPHAVESDAVARSGPAGTVTSIRALELGRSSCNATAGRWLSTARGPYDSTEAMQRPCQVSAACPTAYTPNATRWSFPPATDAGSPPDRSRAR